MGEPQEKIGVKAVLETADFQKGLNQYNAGLSQATQATSASTGKMAVAWNDLTKRFHELSTNRMVPFANIMRDKVQPSVAGAALSMTNLSGAATVLQQTSMLATAGGVLLADALKTIASSALSAMTALKNFGVQATLAAGRNEELAIVAQYMGQQAGYTAKQIDDYATSLQKAGARVDASYDLITQFSRAEIDLAKSTDLLNVAQGAAIVSGRDTSDVTQQLIAGIITLQPEMLRSAGIIISTEEAMRKYADEMGVAVGSLTGIQRQQAMLNETLVQGAKLSGLYAEAMKMPGKQLRSLTGREIPDLIAKLGEPFQNAFRTIIETVRDLVKGFAAAVSEGGKLYPLMVQLGAVASLLADGFKGAVKWITAAAQALEDQLSGGLLNAIRNALVWGQNFVVSFANGIVTGAGDALNAAAKYVSDILASWFAPGSPPRVAPDISKWGSATVGEWLQGFQEADFSLLNQIQGPLENALNIAFGSAGKQAAGEAFQTLSGEILDAIDAGELSTQLFDKISAAGGELGKQLALLTKYQIDLNTAMQAGVVSSQDMVLEYNQMLRAGAAQADLDAKLLAIREAEAGTNKVGDLQKQVALQAAIVAQQQKLVGAEFQPTGATAGAGGGAGGAGGGAGAVKPVTGAAAAGVPFDFSPLANKMGEAVEAAKTKLVEGLQGIWDKITTWFNEKVVPKIGEIWKAVTDYFAPVIANVRGGLAQMNIWWENNREAIFTAIGKVTKRLEVFGKFLTDIFPPAVRGPLTLITGYWEAFWLDLNGDADAAQRKRIESQTFFFLDMKRIFDRWSIEYERSNRETWATIVSVWFTAVKKILTRVEEWVGEISKAFTSIDWLAVGAIIMDGIGQGIRDRMKSVASDAVKAAQGIIDGIKKALKSDSPSKVMIKIGYDVMTGLESGIKQGAGLPTVAAARAAAMVPMATAPIMQNNSTSISMNMGGVNIYNPMQLAQFESMLTRVLKGAR